METILKTFAIYGVILVLTRLCGRRTLSQATPFDVVLVLLIAEAAQNVLLGGDASLTNAVLVIVTLILADVALSYLKLKVPAMSLLVEGAPTVLIDEGQQLKKAMQSARVAPDDVLESARLTHGISNFDQIRFAVLETSGAISIIPFPSDETGGTDGAAKS